MSDSVPPGDIKLDMIMEMLADLGDARAAWAAIQTCIAEGLALPDWVLRYLANVAREIENVHPGDRLSLWRATGFYGERKGRAYDGVNDPEAIHGWIAEKMAIGEVRSVAEGARLYVKQHERANDPESVRKRYYEGRRKAPPVPDGAEIR